MVEPRAPGFIEDQQRGARIPLEDATPQQALFLNVLVVAPDGNGVHNARNEALRPYAAALLRMPSRDVAALYRPKRLISHVCCGVALAAGESRYDLRRAAVRPNTGAGTLYSNNGDVSRDGCRRVATVP